MKSLICLAGVLCLIFVVLVSDLTAGIPITERDYISDRWRKFHGTRANVGDMFYLTFDNKAFQQHVTFTLSKDSDLYIEIYPMNKSHAAFVMLASEPSSLRNMKAVWYENDLRNPTRFWVSRYFVPVHWFNANGYAKIQFKVLYGDLELKILDSKNLHPVLPR